MHPATDPDPGVSPVTELVVRRLGRRTYADGRAHQERAARAVERGGPDELLLLEHPPVITVGRGGTASQVLASPKQLARAGITLVSTDRGGGATYHGPGQLVGYPIVDLRRRGLGVRAYLRAVEAALITALRDAGVCAGVRSGLTGVWTERGKIVSIGIAVRRGITRHGFALNVRTDLGAFRRIVPCGLHEPITSLEQLGRADAAGRISARIAGALSRALGDPGCRPRGLPRDAPEWRSTGAREVAR
jgi:lipoyl(octanoyl) transferase